MIEFQSDGVKISIDVTPRGDILVTATDLSYNAGAVTAPITRDQAVQMAAALILAAAEADQATGAWEPGDALLDAVDYTNGRHLVTGGVTVLPRDGGAP